MTTVAEFREDSPGLLRRTFAFVRRYGLILWIVALLLFTAAIVVRRWQEFEQIVAALRTADPAWLVLGVAIETAILIVIALTYRTILRRLRHDLPGQTLLSAHLQRTAIGAVSPLGGPTSVYVFVRYVRRYRVSTDDALLTVALRSIAGQVAFVLLLVAALLATGSEFGLPGLAVLVAIGAAGLVVRRLRPFGPGPGSGWTDRLPAWARERTEQFRRRAHRHQLVPRDLALPLGLTIATRLGTIGILYASLHALGTSASFGLVATAYCAAMFAHLAVPIFHGAGAVETATAVALTHAGMETETAIGAVLLWRLLECWLPIGIGLLLQIGSVAARWNLPSLRPAVPNSSRPLQAVATATALRGSSAVRRDYHAKR
jgi:uncharacterized membrane protein YbhN (UPF0104 family)